MHELIQLLGVEEDLEVYVLDHGLYQVLLISWKLLGIFALCQGSNIKVLNIEVNFVAVCEFLEHLEPPSGSSKPKAKLFCFDALVANSLVPQKIKLGRCKQVTRCLAAHAQ